MDGSAALDEVLAYLSRLTGEDITLDQRLTLRSIQRVALASWARQAGVAVRGGLINSGEAFSVRELLSAEGTEPAAVPMRLEPVLAVAGAVPGIGIDIEDVSALPEADDFREHPFYSANFTPAEISHCIRQADARMAFCGTWAAKEAILKASAGANLMRLIDIEIVRDAMGRPGHPGCTISISHAGQTAVAVCLRLPAPAVVAPAVSLAPEVPPAAPAPAAGGKRWKALAAISVVIVLGLVIYGVMRGGI